MSTTDNNPVNITLDNQHKNDTMNLKNHTVNPQPTTNEQEQTINKSKTRKYKMKSHKNKPIDNNNTTNENENTNVNNTNGTANRGHDGPLAENDGSRLEPLFSPEELQDMNLMTLTTAYNSWVDPVWCIEAMTLWKSTGIDLKGVTIGTAGWHPQMNVPRRIEVNVPDQATGC